LDEADAAKGFTQRNNTTLSIDGFIRPKDQFNIQYLVTASRNNTGDSIGLAGNFWIEYTPNKLYAYWKTQYIDEKYLPGMGFISTSNTLYNNGGGYLIWRPNKGKAGNLIRRWDPGVFIETYQDARTMKFQSGNIYLFPVYIFFKNNFFIEYSIYPTWEHFFFSPLGFPVAPDKYFFVRQQLRATTDASKKISGGINYFWGNYYDGRLQEINLDARIAPSPKMAFTVSYQLNKIRGLGVNDADERSRWNARGSWEFAPLSFLYIVFNESSFKNSLVQNKSLISKITYLKQF
jgi:hypothetical protein